MRLTNSVKVETGVFQGIMNFLALRVVQLPPAFGSPRVIARVVGKAGSNSFARVVADVKFFCKSRLR